MSYFPIYKIITEPTNFAFNSGVLQKKDPHSTIWNNFTIKGLNYGPIPPGFDPGGGRLPDPLQSIHVAKWFAEQFSTIHGNAVRVYWNIDAQLGGSQAETQGLVYADRVLKCLDMFYANGIYVMFDIFINFTFFNSSGATIQNWYKNNIAQGALVCVQTVMNHPATLGYILGNEVNANLGTWMTLSNWWTYTNTLASAIKRLDPNHIVGPNSTLTNPTDISNAVSAESAGSLANCDFHSASNYRGNGWIQPSTVGGANTTLWQQWTPSNNKRLIISECGIDSYDQNAAAENQTTQANATTNLWTTRDTTKNSGIFFFEAFDELWKAGNTGTAPTNDGNYTNSYFVANSDSFFMPDGASNEQWFGWWKYVTSTPYDTPPSAKSVVAAMSSTW